MLSSFTFFSPLVLTTQADDQVQNTAQNQTFSASIGALGLSKDLSLNVFDGELDVGIPAGRFAEPTIVQLTKIPETTKPPAGLKMVGTMYQIDIPAASFHPGQYYISLKSIFVQIGDAAPIMRTGFFEGKMLYLLAGAAGALAVFLYLRRRAKW